MTVIPMQKKVLSENQIVAARLRSVFQQNGTFCLNLVSSPGSGKTALLERTLASFEPDENLFLLTGDLQTENDAKRLARGGFPVQQIITNTVCHLDSGMIERALAHWSGRQIDLLFIENVGNLVCPSSYDLGEDAKVVLLSVTEGEDKPLKYPSIFAKSSLLLITKVDLLPYVPFDIEQARANARIVHPGIDIIEVSSTTGQGMDQWVDWLRSRRHASQIRSRELQAQPISH